MASYKDPANLKFNPYVQQLPVEAMAKVGQYKQERYDKGVEKIQQSIDNIAGLDIAKPEDKEYLQSKLNSLGSQLTNVAGGDFSNFALVNSVNGMTNQIAKDPKILGAVSDTAKYKKDIEAVEKLQLEGKWAPSNNLQFQENVSKWFNTEDSRYSNDVSPYVNVQEDSQKIIKGLAEQVTNREVMFDYAEDGKTIIGVRDVMTKETIKEITPERIQTALKSGLSPQAWRQLSLDGKYKYSNTTTDKYISDINNSYKERFTYLSEVRSEIQNALTNAEPKNKKQLKNSLDEYDKLIAQNKREYDSVSKGFEEGDIGNSKAQFHTIKWMENISQSFSSRDYDVDTKITPYFEVKYKKDMRNLAYAKFEEVKTNNEIMQDLKRRQVEAEESIDPMAGSPLTIPGETKSDRDRIAENIELTEKTKVDSERSRSKVSKLMGWDDQLRFVDVNNDGIFNEGDYEESKNYIGPKGQRALTEFDRNLQNAKINRYKTIQLSSLPAVKEYINLQRDNDTNVFRTAKIQEELNAQVPLDFKVPEEYQNLRFEGMSDSGMREIGPLGIVELTRQLGKFVKKPVNPGGRDFFQYDDQGVIDKYGEGSLEHEFYKNVFKGSVPQSAPEAVFNLPNAPFDNNTEFSSVVGNMVKLKVDEYTMKIKAREELHSELLLKTILQDQGVAVPLLVDDKTVKNLLTSNLGDIANVIENRGGWMETSISASDIILIKDDLTDASLLTDTKELRVSGGGLNKTIPLTDDQFRGMADKFNIEVEKDPLIASFDKNYTNRLLSTNPQVNQKDFWTTAVPDLYQTEQEGNSQRNTTFANAYLENFDFPNVKFMNVTGNIVTLQNPSEIFNEGFLQLNVRIGEPTDSDLDGVKEYPYEQENIEIPVPLGKAKLTQMMLTLDDDALFYLLFNRKLEGEDLKALENQKINIPK